MTFDWPVPDGWGHETIPFPLPFAPGLPYRGTEELRFMPGWAKSGAPDHWAYLFAWWLEGSAPPDETELAPALATYYAGLCAAVAERPFEPEGFRVALTPTGRGVRAGHPAQHFDGTADLVDVFGNGEPLTLHLRLEAWACPVAGRAVVLIEASPTVEPSVRERLTAQAAAFTCH